jgi:hypothetical protein
MVWAATDIVPNHMAYTMDNPRLFDVLERVQNRLITTTSTSTGTIFDPKYRAK